MSSLNNHIKNISALVLPLLILGLLFSSCRSMASQITYEVGITVESPESTPEPVLKSTPEEIPSESESSDPSIVDDFEEGTLSTGTDPNGLSIGYVLWGDSASSVDVSNIEIPAEDDASMPEQSGPNRVLALTADVSGWGGVTHNFSNDALDTWLTMDWSTYEGVSFWIYGLGSGTRLLFEIQENRNPDSTSNDVEIWSYSFVDDFSGWQQIQLTWEDFSRKEIGNGAPNDGLGLQEVHGWAFGMLTTPGELTYYLDEIQLFGERDPLANITVTFDQEKETVREGGRASLNVKLSALMADEVSVGYRIQDGSADVHKDYEPLDGRLTFDPGTLSQFIFLQTVEDEKPEPVEHLTVILTDAEGVELGLPRRLLLTITDDDRAQSRILVDVEGAHPFIVEGEGQVLTQTLTPSNPIAMPGQGAFEDVLSVSEIDGSLELKRVWSTPQDWSDGSGIRFWYYGTGEGQRIEVGLINNPGLTTADLGSEAWSLQWEDDFKGQAGSPPDLTYWRPEIGDGLLNGLTGWGNNELQYYTDTPENVSLDGEGNLVITAEALGEEEERICWYGPCEFTSARLITQDRYEFTYGRVEARMILPEGNGLWPAFWLLGRDINAVGWPMCGEVDIMEFIGRVPDTVYGSLHGPGYSGGDNVGAAYQAGTQISSDFHTYAIEWEPEEIRWYVDDILFSTVTPADVNGQWVFDHPFFILLNLAVGGHWPGNPDESTMFPQSLVIDFVRVYGAGDTHERFSASFVDDFVGWGEIEIPFEDFSRSPLQPEGAPDDGLDLTQMFGFSMMLPESEDSYSLDQFQLSE